MEKMIRGRFFRIEKYDNEKVSLLSTHNYRIFNPISGEVSYVSSDIKYINKVVFNPTNDLRMTYDIDGRLKIYNNTGIIYKENVGYNPIYGCFQSYRNGFLYYNQKKDVLSFWTPEHILTLKTNLPERVNSIIPIDDELFLLTLSDYDENYTSIYQCSMKDEGFNVEFVSKLSGAMGFMSHPQLTGDICAYNIMPNSDCINRAIYDDIALYNHSDCTYSLFFKQMNMDNKFEVLDFKISPDMKQIAIINIHNFYVFSIADRRTIVNETIKYGSCIYWIDNNTLLIGTWDGLYKYYLEA